MAKEETCAGPKQLDYTVLLNEEQPFRDRIVNIIEQIIETYGGSGQYLLSRFDSKESQDEFAIRLEHSFPREASRDADYVKGQLPDHRWDVLLHCSDLGFQAHCSSKLPPYAGTVRQLAEEIAMQGFASEAEPLLLVDTSSSAAVLSVGASPTFWVSYVKGMARATTLLCIADCLIQAGYDTKNAPRIQSTFGIIHARRHMAAMDKAAIALENARLSAAGSIRKGHDLIQWFGKLLMLKSFNYDPPEILAKWNQQATKDHRIVGAKQMSIMRLLKFQSPEVEKLLFGAVNEFGVEHLCWTEDMHDGLAWPARTGCNFAN